jgi:4-hydroxybenzoate polyprenyltransferase
MEFLRQLRAILLLCRPANLFLAATTQWLTFQFIIAPAISNPLLTGWVLYQFIACTVLLAAGGFVINDILDIKTDLINRQRRTFLPRVLSVNTAYILYTFFVLTGAVLAVHIASRVGNLWLSTIYFGWAFLLFAYSKWLKATVLLGNIVVSLFIAGTPAMLGFAERKGICAIDNEQHREWVLELLLVMVAISFLVNLAREIVKDMEDKPGDLAAGMITFAGRFHERTVLLTIMGLLSGSIVLIVGWLLKTSVPLALQQYAMMILFVLAPLGVGIQIVTKSTHKRHMTDLSGLLKWILAAGVVTLILTAKSIQP